MILPTPPASYSSTDQSQVREAFRRADAENLKRNRDIEVAGGRVILPGANGTRYALTVDNAGVLGTVAV